MVHLTSGGSTCGLRILPQASIFLLLSVHEAGSWRPFASTPSGTSLGAGGGVSAPIGSFSAGSAFFAGLFRPFILCHEGIGIVAASVYLSRLNLMGLKFHHSEGGVSASSDASEIQIVSSVHGVRQRLPIHGSLLWSLRGSSGLHAGQDSGFRVYPRLDSASALSTRLSIQASSHK